MVLDCWPSLRGGAATKASMVRSARRGVFASFCIRASVGHAAAAAMAVANWRHWTVIGIRPLQGFSRIACGFQSASGKLMSARSRQNLPDDAVAGVAVLDLAARRHEIAGAFGEARRRQISASGVAEQHKTAVPGERP